VPTAFELAKNDDDRALLEFVTSSAELGQAFIAPPNVPPHIVEALRRAFDKTMQDPDYINFSKKVGNELGPLSGAELATFAAKTLATPKNVVDRYTAATAVR
jgi:tripartite-type tricarboxylate transporter receptor subunit TctC